jgi:hypothetical protein
MIGDWQDEWDLKRRVSDRSVNRHDTCRVAAYLNDGIERMPMRTAAVQGELDRVSQTLTARIRELAERYATPLPQLTEEVGTLAVRVDAHLRKMGAQP